MHNKENNKQSKTYVQGLRPFGNILPKSVKGILKKNGYNYSEIMSKWNMLVGKEISESSFPKSIKMKQGDSKCTLILAVKRGDEIIVEYSKNEIMNKINSYFGYQLVNNIRLQALSSGSKKKKIKNNSINFSDKIIKKVLDIKSETIKNSLSKLIDSIK
jgi:hypothetical protein